MCVSVLERLQNHDVGAGSKPARDTKMQKQFINQIKADQKIDSIFLVTQKTVPAGKTGKAYLNLRLADKTGEVDAKVWDHVDTLSPLCEQGTIARFVGKSLLYQGKVQLNILEIHPIDSKEINASDFLPCSVFDPEIMYSELMSLIKTQVTEPNVKKLLLTIFENPEIARKYKKAPAAKTMHHAFIAGLLEHALGLTKLAVDVCKHYPHIEPSYVIAGCLLHDIGKIDELSYDTNFEYTMEGKLIGHLVMGIELIGKTAALIPNFPTQVELLLKHLIASHHGSLAFGSPKVPHTLEALMVHYLDDMDSKLQAMKTLIDREWDTPTAFTSYHRLFDRFMYKGTKWEEEKKSK